MNWISIAFFLIASLICCTFCRRDADFISPARVFGLTWSIVFALSNLKLSGLQINWTLEQWMYALLGPISFLLGLFIAYMMNINVRLVSINKMRMVLRERKLDDDKLFYLIVVAFAAYIVGYIVISVVKGYIPIFASNPAAARIDYFIFGIGLFMHHMPIVVSFSVVYHLVVRNNRGKKKVLKIIVLISILTYLFLLQRYQLIMISVMLFTILYYASRHIRIRTVMSFLVLGVFFIYSIATLRVGQIIQIALYTTSRMKFSYHYAIFTEPYMYIVMNIENFVHAISKLDQYTYGYYSLDFIFAVTGLKYPLKEYFRLEDNPYLISGFNTYSIFWTSYRDFGLLGISFLPLMAGLFVGFIYYSMRRNPTIALVMLYSILVFVIALSFFLSPLGFLWFVYIIALMILILRLIRVRNMCTIANVT